eukprot:CAMPEP_0194034070 /NCGR_PEP_ID=MMETSP0009_2-20130614/6481_1 /TAXON_ID=210454 /ORGANISM="Grammatophora oceanica, Strain CCMP 410" /LENGTH=57 /DNA_ID=CAMNT_0038674815 /DNA_START=663 /DNA_END=836 /DNA_ORIENTATION=+
MNETGSNDRMMEQDLSKSIVRRDVVRTPKKKPPSPPTLAIHGNVILSSISECRCSKM